MGPAPAVAAIRLAVRRVLAPAPAGPVVVACSGGADSLALLAAAVFETRESDRSVVGATVDHGLQEGSDERAAQVVAQMADIGADETLSARVSVMPDGRGLEAAARDARYAVLEQVAQHFASPLVLLGHTLDDQAETVLLGLTRGSGGRSIAGMRRTFAPFARPLLDLTRAQTEAACQAEGIDFWTDPHNTDPRFTRSRVRHTVLPMLERELGPGVGATLARTGEMLQEDLEALDAAAADAFDALGLRSEAGVTLSVSGLGDLPAAVRRRVLRSAALAAGSPAPELFRVHVLAVDELVVAWRGQKWVDLPGHLRARRGGDTVTIEPTPVAGWPVWMPRT